MTDGSNESPERFYYYTSLEEEVRKDWFRRIVIDNEVYFRNRDQLNDPNELRPKVVFEGTDKEFRTYVRQMILRYWPVKLSPAKRLAEETKLIYKYRSGAGWVSDILHAELNRVGVFCVSSTPTEELMWAHYANGHRGVAIEFDSNVGLFTTAQRIDYVTEAPVINRIKDNRDSFLEKTFFTKSERWVAEQEWRVITRWEDRDRIERYIAERDFPVDVKEFLRSQHGPGYYAIPPDSIRGVILGNSISPELEKWVREAASESTSNIPIKKASFSGYNLEIVD